MPSIEIDSRWKMPNGEVATVTGILVSPYEMLLDCTFDSRGGREVWMAHDLVRAAEKLPPSIPKGEHS